ncbi:MAG: LysM peptidoglycan-binding domain-containing protein, partial [Mesorhizobium sp.]
PAKPAETAPATAEPALPALPSNSGDIAGTPPSVPAETATSAPAEAAKPAETAPTEAKPAGSSPESSHVIAAGDTYWDLAKKAYGDGTKWKLISEANKDYKPRRLPLGGTLTIPPAAK